MQYELNVESVSTIRRRLHFTLAKGEVKGELDRAFSDLKRKVRIPGFRPGKVPRQLLEARFGPQITGEVSGKLIDRVWRLAARDLEVAGQPALEDQGELKLGADFAFTIGVDVKPVLELDGYKGVAVSYTTRPVADGDVERRVQARLAGKARMVEIDDRGVQPGDVVLAAITLDADGETLADEPGTMVSTVGERYYPGVEALLLGLAKGESAEGEVTIGEGSAYEHLRGKAVQAKVRVEGINANKIPDLDDALAEELGYEGGADGMRGAIRLEIETALQEEGRTQARVALLQKLVADNSFDVPSGMVDEQLQALVEELKVRRAYAGEDPRTIRFSEAEMADLRGRATFAAKSSVILAAVARQEGIDCTPADLDAKIEEIASLRGQTVQAIRGYLEREDAMPVLTDRILEEKTLEWLLENADLSVSEEAAAPAPAGEAPVVEAAAEEAPAAAEAAAPSWNAKMKKGELLEIAQGLGLDVNTKSKKDEILAALEAHGA